MGPQNTICSDLLLYKWRGKGEGEEEKEGGEGEGDEDRVSVRKLLSLSREPALLLPIQWCWSRNQPISKSHGSLTACSISSWQQEAVEGGLFLQHCPSNALHAGTGLASSFPFPQTPSTSLPAPPPKYQHLRRAHLSRDQSLLWESFLLRPTRAAPVKWLSLLRSLSHSSKSHILQVFFLCALNLRSGSCSFSFISVSLPAPPLLLQASYTYLTNPLS